MKKKLLVLGIAIVMALSMAFLASCGKTDPNIGKYKVIEMMDMSIDDMNRLAGKDVSDAVTLELKDGGKGVITIENESTEIEWKVDGETITLTYNSELSIDGTIKDGVIETTTVDGLEVVFEKEKSK